MQLDRNGLEVLDRAQCLHLLGTVALGRIAISRSALPVVLPVHFTLWNEQIVINVAASSTLHAAVDNAVVAFEADDIHPVLHSGWSVAVTGATRELTERPEQLVGPTLPPDRWTGSATERYVAISTDLVSGRRFLPAPTAPTTASDANL